MITKDLGMVTAYAYAVSKGYTGTEEEFAELMASYASVAQTAVDAALAAAQSAQAAESAKDTAQTTVDGAIAGIQAEGQTQIGAVQSEGTTQVGNVNAAGTTQVGAVQAKGTEVINSIPSDYTALTGEVTDLKSAINNVEENMNMSAKNIAASFDMAFSDNDFQTILAIKDGHVKTKNFDSQEVGSLSDLNTEADTIVDAINSNDSGMRTSNTESDYDLSVEDGYGSAIVRLQDGNIKTKNFNSELFPKDAETGKWFSYIGQEMHLVKNKCRLSVIFSLTGWTPSTLQGGAIYGDYYFQFDNSRAHCGIYNIKTGELTQLFTFGTSDSNWHCNNANFGSEFFSSEDLFPLLYVPQEHIDVHNVHVLRISGEIGNLMIEHVQTITWDSPDVCNMYYPNSIVDADNNIIYQYGYTSNNYVKSPSNMIKICGYSLPSLSDGDVALHVEDADNAFEVESVTACQGSFVNNGIIYQIFGQFGDRGIRAINPCTQKVESYMDIKPMLAQSGNDIEPESFAAYKGCFAFVGSSKKMIKIELGRAM